ncbi:Piwi-domain-containing protein [Cucurbitaria berberidis CBS 394.84]|uniref:Piwi-domain-containing protein n=1 Tax=Cucurbitaria berberidis CBS 394.84 TaxID=1168544 RepID=A0A9P4LCA8_9PLEO|nr:Piwi-domain-containing protein [Cucurbitaria berberidis CBS 394.84]KAF1849518.1 Piwi-domain-containing protein [Cucurbitaria berberidis CBS 394.84]
MPLSDETKDLIKAGLVTKPCIKCGDGSHPLINCPGGTRALSGSVWKSLKGTEVKEAENEYSKIRRAYVTNLKAKKKAAKNADSTQATTVPPATEPIIAPEGFLSAATVNAGIPVLHEATETAQLRSIQDQALAEQVETKLGAPTPAPGTSQVLTGHLHQPEATFSQIVDTKFPLRKTLSKPSSQVLTNHFEVSWNDDTTFYVYEIMNIPICNKRKAKSIVETAIQAWDFLNTNEDYFATDYLKTIVAWKNLHENIQCPRTTAREGEVVWAPIPIADGDRRIELSLKFEGSMNLNRLKDFVNPKSKPDDATLPNFNSSPLVTHLNTVISKSLTDDVFQTSSHKFFLKTGYSPLGTSNSLCIMRGYDYTVRPAMEKVLLNVNIATSAFFRPITVAEFLEDRTFAENEREKRIKRLRVYIVPDRQSVKDPDDQKRVDNLNMPQNRIKTIKAFGKPIGNRMEPRLSFPKWIKVGNQLQQNGEVHVVDHMKAVFGQAHKFDEKLKAVNVGTDDDPIWYPQEFLRILPYQLYNNLLPDKLVDSMLESACKTPPEVRARIEAEGLKGLGVIQSNGVQKFEKCNALSIRPNMLLVPSTRMEQVFVAYAAGNPIAPKMDDKAQWNLAGKTIFLETPTANQNLSYYMLIDPELRDVSATVKTYKTAIAEKVSQHGIAKGATCVAETILPKNLKDGSAPDDRYNSNPDIEMAINTCKNMANGQLVVLLLGKRNIPVYSAFKDVADRISGLQSVCVTEEKNRGKPATDKGLGQYFSNVMMKVNLKQKGRNHTVCDNNKGGGRLREVLRSDPPKRGIMILGSDVTHPTGSSLVGCPSIAALVGSTDYDGGKFLGSMRLQNRSKKEMIDEIKPMAKERFQAWKDKFNPAPHILYYRDGVSTGQYEQVVKEELIQIKEAWKEVWPKEVGDVKMTAVVAVKRHHIRLFPIQGDGHKNGNCKAGTLVDSGITSPFFSEFFLQSHHALQGTARPTRYFVLENGIRLSDTDIQRLTHKLCFTYVRATMGVSYAPPAYYADRLCERGRQYLRDWFTPNYESAHYKDYQSEKDTIDQKHKSALKSAILQLPKQPTLESRRKARKSEAQAKLERESRNRAEDEISAQVLMKAKAYFNERRAGGCGPWHKNLDGTMFWM